MLFLKSNFFQNKIIKTENRKKNKDIALPGPAQLRRYMSGALLARAKSGV
jgi:hypothetical protein